MNVRLPRLASFSRVLVSALALTAAFAADKETSGEKVTRIDARMMRQPDVSAKQIAFVYAGDIWVAPKKGGVATRLSSPQGEESFPRFSPDGTQIAFSGNYDGNLDIYLIPVTGGVPKRLTHHGAPDRVIGWYSDGRSILFASSMTSEKDRFNKLFKVSVAGGLPEQLPVPYGEFGAISPDSKLLAYTPISVDFRTWKRYRGGMNPDIWLFDLESLTAKNLTHSEAADAQPMWHAHTIYFLSDRDDNKRANLWAYDTRTEKVRQITHYKEFDVHFPSIGPKDIVFENAGRLYLLDLGSEKAREVEIQVVTDRATLKPRAQNVSGHLQHATVSPTGKRALSEARGDIYSVPAEYGVVRGVTRTSGVAERFPAWSPDGKIIAYFSDRSGEYELTTRNADGTGEEQTLTALGPGFRYRLHWSPDSRKLAFIDQAMRIQVYDFDTKTNREIDRLLWAYEGDLRGFSVNWSADSRWLAYAGDLDNRYSAVILYDYKEGKRHQVTAGYYNDEQPVFDPDGKYLYYRTSRSFGPTYGELDNSWIYANTTVLAAVPLRKDVASPLAPRNDEEGDKPKDKDKEKDSKPEEKKDEAKKPEEKKPDEPKPAEEKKEEPKKGDEPSAKPEDKPADKADKKDDKAAEKKEDKPKPVEIDLDGFEGRAVILPPKAGRYDNLLAVSGKLLYRRLPRLGSTDERSPLMAFEFEKREEKTVLDDVDFAELAAKREKMLVRKGDGYSIVEPKEGQNMGKRLSTGGFEANIDPVAEWHQIFTEAWRLERDYFYDPGMHGVDWAAMRDRYRKLLDDAVTRWDVNYVLGELIGELNSSHTYRNGGDMESGPSRGVGYLGCDFSLENGAYRIKKIIEAGAWDTEVRSPLRQPGLKVSEGDYLLAVNGEPIDTTQDPWAAFQGLADRTVILTVNDKPVKDGAHDVLVQTLGGEGRLRNLAWIEANRKKVETASGGRIGYVYVPDTGVNGQNELYRQWRSQITRDGLIIDERFNSGGQIPDRFIELLNRPVRNFWGVRDGKDWAWPPMAHFGPKAMLVNGWSGSGGDCFPYYFKQSNLGPLIGLRTWGGLIGMTGVPGLIDGGSVTVPTFGIYDVKGEWIIEGYGVDPDIEVVDDPALMAKGADPQLERAVDEVMKAIGQNPPPAAKKPAYPKRSGF